LTARSIHLDHGARRIAAFEDFLRQWILQLLDCPLQQRRTVDRIEADVAEQANAFSLTSSLSWRSARRFSLEVSFVPAAARQAERRCADHPPRLWRITGRADRKVRVGQLCNRSKLWPQPLHSNS
jgi:hypothetical protein